MDRQEVIIRLKGLKSEFERKSEEVWARGLEHGYDCDNENARTARALEQAIEWLENEK
jgi:hypothetical protein